MKCLTKGAPNGINFPGPTFMSYYKKLKNYFCGNVALPVPLEKMWGRKTANNNGALGPGPGAGEAESGRVGGLFCWGPGAGREGKGKETNVTAPGTARFRWPDTHTPRLEHDMLEAGWTGPGIPRTGCHREGTSSCCQATRFLPGAPPAHTLLPSSHPCLCRHVLLTFPSSFPSTPWCHYGSTFLGLECSFLQVCLIPTQSLSQLKCTSLGSHPQPPSPRQASVSGGLKAAPQHVHETPCPDPQNLWMCLVPYMAQGALQMEGKDLEMGSLSGVIPEGPVHLQGPRRRGSSW